MTSFVSSVAGTLASSDDDSATLLVVAVAVTVAVAVAVVVAITVAVVSVADSGCYICCLIGYWALLRLLDSLSLFYGRKDTDFSHILLCVCSNDIFWGPGYFFHAPDSD